MFIYLLYLFNHPSKSLIIPWVIKVKLPNFLNHPSKSLIIPWVIKMKITYFPNHISKSLIIPWEIKMINCKTRLINGLIWIPCCINL